MGHKAKLKALENRILELTGCLWPCETCGGTGMKDTHPCAERQASVLCPHCHGFNVERTKAKLTPIPALPNHYHLGA